MKQRERICLDGAWKFQIASNKSHYDTPETIDTWRQIQVPMPWQAQFDDLRLHFGRVWYKHSFQAPADWTKSTVLLHFGAVNYYAQVWLNDTMLGEHEGGYLPFEFEVGPVLRPDGLNDLVVQVTLPSDDVAQYPDFPFSEIPHGKQSWYGPLGGIWQSVWLEHRSPLHLSHIRLTPDLSTGKVQANITLSKPLDDQRLSLSILDADQTVVSTSVYQGKGKDQTVTLELTVDSPQAWSPDHPYLYTLKASLSQEGEVIDHLTECFGFRTIEAKAGQLLLNGKPFYLRGALDQDYYPDTIATPPSIEFLEDQIRKAKAMGLNCFRCHIKVPDPRYYEVADQLGMLIWTDLPNWQHLTEKAKQRGLATLEGMLERDGNHPSIIAWSIINEDWGTDLVNNPAHRVWLKETYHWLKELNPTRLIVDNSPCVPNLHIQTDIEDYHYYQSIPDHRQGWDEFIGSFAQRADWTFSQNGDAVRTRNEPLVMSEFGNWGLPDVDRLVDDEGQEPWWFETGEDWNEGVMYPHGVKRRFQMWHLQQVFGSWQTFIEATQWQQHQALKYQIEVMRQYSSISGYVITELTDAHWEANGLMDLRRNPRVFHTELATINADTIITPQWQRLAYQVGETIEVALSVAHGAGQPLIGARLTWTLSLDTLKGHFDVPYLEAGQVGAVANLAFTAPVVDTPTMTKLNFSLVALDGTLLATNHLALTIFPQPSASSVRLWSPNDALSDALTELGYQLASALESADLIVTETLDETLASCVRQGKRLLLLANHPEAIAVNYSGINLIARKDTPWAGDWASSFAWLRRDGAFAHIPGGPLLDFSFDGLIPDYVLTGFSPQNFEAEVHAGIFVGWIHKMAALIAERRYGQGKIIVSTFALTPKTVTTHPTATALLQALIESLSASKPGQ